MTKLQTYLFTSSAREGFEIAEVYYAESVEQAKTLFAKRHRSHHLRDDEPVCVCIVNLPTATSIAGDAAMELVEQFGGENEDDDEEDEEY
jgi:hypothetical protein